ncbi:protein ABIL1 [Syzygium oleosum]|uniref:protein ABIL1 n=1 Tax=Syzygium oleosum TaxID=219896 RepID=UPI0024B9A77F|nr:protein ABIL1 [Syzygium oleosum]
METERPRSENPAMTFDEVSMERSKSFVKALQELKNLRPQLYSAAEYCEKSYLNSEQKQMVLDNLKDYAVRALVNAVDHLGTVAYKLTDLIEQQSLDITVMELKVTSFDQQLLTCQTYTDKEGLRQQQLLAIIPRHHKHYMLPNSVNKKVHFSPQIQKDVRQNHFQPRSRLQPSGTPAAKTLSWHLASETKSSLKGTQNASASTEDYVKKPEVFHLLDNGENALTRFSAGHLQVLTGGPTYGAVPPSIGAAHRVICYFTRLKVVSDDVRKVILWSSSAATTDSWEGTKPLSTFRSFDNPNRREIVRAPARSKSMLSAFFVKTKTPKMKASAVS